jgi:hypothetical protein
MTLLILAGCATNGPVKPETKVEKTPETAAPIPLVVPLQEGRQGFVINEVAKMDDASRRDFESAVAMLKEEEYDKAIELLKRVIEQSPGVSAPYINTSESRRRPRPSLKPRCK